jgi:hypothetical protein
MDENFDQLRRLLALKRYEAPPPGYFHSFSGKVMARIEAAEAAVAPAWWQKLGFDFNLKPAMVCGLGVVVCGLLSAGVLTSVVTADQPVAGVGMMEPPQGFAIEASPFGEMYAAESAESTRPVFAATRYDQFGFRAPPASFQFRGK